MSDRTHNHDSHDEGFVHDLPRLLGRRSFLSGLTGVGLVAANPAAALECVALPWETAGPYPADGSNSRAGQILNVLTQEGVIREDLRSSFAGYEGTSDGTPLTLELTLSNADGCTPLAGHAIYIWHCDALGEYSLYNITDQNYLRAVGVSDDDGKLRFTTIYPGCYDGRWPHIHFEIFTSPEAAVSGKESVLTAQIAMPADISAKVYAKDDRYSNGTRNLGRISIPTDNVFSDNTEAQIGQQTLAVTGTVAQGLHGTMTIPVDFNAERSVQIAPPPGGGKGGRPPKPPKQ